MDITKNTALTILSAIWCVSVAGSIICGILECFNISTGVIGAAFGMITMLPIPLALLWLLCCYILHLLYPGWEKEKIHRIGMYVLIAILVNLLWTIFC